MTEPAEKIVVFDSYDNVIHANLAKLKLDAYGIPCFLTDEHFVNLYPIRNDIFPGVRLHVFERDLAKVKDVLAEEHPLTENEILACPRCHSKNVLFEDTQKNWLGRLSLILLSFLFVDPIAYRKKVYHCRSCDTEFSL